MYEDYLGNLTVNDARTFDQKVRYIDIDVNGDAVFCELADCECLNVDGNAVFHSTVTCDDFLIGGNAVLKKNLLCRNTVISGKTEIYGNVHSDIVNVGGLTVVNGSLSSISVTVAGKLSVNRKTVADRIRVTGALESKSKVRCLEFRSVYNGGTTRLVRLDAELIESKSNIFVPTDYALVCDEINCHLAKLDYSNVGYLFCDSAKIGKGSYVRKLECHCEPEISPGAIVEEIIRY